MLTDLTDQVYTSDAVVLSRTMMMLWGTVVSSLDQIRAVAKLGGRLATILVGEVLSQRRFVSNLARKRRGVSLTRLVQ